MSHGAGPGNRPPRVFDRFVALADLVIPVGREAGPRLGPPARPADLQPVDRPRRAQPEGEPEVVLREVAGPRGQPAGRRPSPGGDRHPGPDWGPARPLADQPEADPVAPLGPVPEDRRRL